MCHTEFNVRYNIKKVQLSADYWASRVNFLINVDLLEWNFKSIIVFSGKNKSP